MAEMRDIMIGFVIGLGVFMGLFNLFQDVTDDAGVDVPVAYTGLYENITLVINDDDGDSLNNLSTSLYDRALDGADTDEGLEDSTKSILEGFVLILSLPKIIYNVVESIIIELGLPAWFGLVSMLALTLLFVFLIYSAIRGKDV